MNLFRNHDVVVLLHGGGWSHELRSNRWHYARHFSLFAPLVIAQGGGPHMGRVDTEERLPNTTILEIGGLRPFLDNQERSAEVITQYISDRGFNRPLVWVSNPLTWNTVLALPAWPCVFHATEDYSALAAFNLQISSSYFKACALACANGADAILACTPGVAASLSAQTGRGDIVATTNGVSLDDYGSTAPVYPVDIPIEVLATALIFAGNINKRLDLLLLRRVALELPQRTIVLIGPVSLPPREAVDFAHLIALPNVIHRTAMSTPEVHYLYRNCSLGIIPYLCNDVIVRAGFPLKTLEMLASGLPVVTSHMDATHELSTFVQCAHDDDEFVSLCRKPQRKPPISSSDKSASNLGVIDDHSYSILIPKALSKISVLLEGGTSRHRERVKPSFIRIVFDSAATIRSMGFRDFGRGLLRLLNAR